MKGSKIKLVGGYTQGKDQILEIDENESGRKKYLGFL